MMGDEATQPSTQQTTDPRRFGRNNSGLSEADISDVLCILHPCTPAAFEVVSSTARRAPQHVLQNGALPILDGVATGSQTRRTSHAKGGGVGHGQDLALRLSSTTNRPALGFVFGRNPFSDIILDVDSLKRISNSHFRIYANESSIIMLQDMSTNGTLVDGVHLKARDNPDPATRMLTAGSIIQILSPNSAEIIKFIVRVPSRDEHTTEFIAKFQHYMARVKIAEQRERAEQARLTGPAPRLLPAVQNDLPAHRGPTVIKPDTLNSNFGMKWNGGDKYNVVAHLGNGAFATVYMLATKDVGKEYAAKELEKRRCMKNGVLDQRIDNELKIMKDLHHPHIVEYVDYHDIEGHLYIIMEYIPLGDLQQYLEVNDLLSELQAQIMSRQVLRALAYLHDKNITHRDIKPDNILIASFDPFIVKLSDFGLSKVVKNNETFLKTFCGTLLYCAPEVFPHFSAHALAKGTKRRRDKPQAPSVHAYSQSVDIWSYAAVVWFSLCGKPPVEGVADQTGLAMFNKIMDTELDSEPLKEQDVSDCAIDLLVKMLNTDPLRRPSDRDCLRHPWLADGAEIPELERDAELGAIQEEAVDEIEDDGPDMSQLSIKDRSKRLRAEFKEYREEDPEDSAMDSSLGPPSPLLPSFKIPSPPPPRQSEPKRRVNASELLFGEIGKSSSKSSGLLGPDAHAALGASKDDMPSATDSQIIRAGLTNDPVDDQVPRDVNSEDDPRSSHYTPGVNAKAVSAAASLCGAESLVRDLRMGSPSSVNSPATDSTTQSTPKTPEKNPSHHLPSQVDKAAPVSNESAPKRVPFSRRIQLPPLDLEPYEAIKRKMAKDAETDKATAPTSNTEKSPPKPDIHTDTKSEEAKQSNSPKGDPIPSIDAPDSTKFIRPRAPLAKLSSTTDSFTRLTLRLDARESMWGRDPANTHVYAAPLDTRVPKRAFVIYFHAAGIEAAERAGDDWTAMPGLHCVICTEANNGIWINGVHLRRRGDHGRFFGRVYSGDEILVFRSPTGSDRLAFECEFFVGEAAQKRPADGPRFRIQEEHRP